MRDALASLQTAGGYTPCDGLRAIAMLWVIIFHSTSHMLFESRDTGTNILRNFWSVAWSMSGDTAVDLFLVLSGFLLGTALIREIQVAHVDQSCSDSAEEGGRPLAKPLLIRSWVKFYMRRWFRIAPAYFSALALSTLFDFPTTSGSACRKFWWSHVLFINNYYPEWEPLWHENCMLHSWSVAVEVQLYVCSPPLFALASLLSRLTRRLSPSQAVVLLSFLLWMCSCLWRVRYLLVLKPGAPNCPYVFTEYRASSYLAGVIAAMFVQEMIARPRAARSCRRALATTVASLASYVVILLMIIFGAEPMYLFYTSDFGPWYKEQAPTLFFLHAALGRPLLGAAAAYLLARAVTDRAPLLSRILSARFWRPLAGLSYSMYLLQYLGWKLLFLPLYPSFGLSQGEGDLGVWYGTLVVYMGSALAVVGTVPLALLSYVFVETAGMKLGKLLMTEGLRTPVPVRVKEPDFDGSPKSTVAFRDEELARALSAQVAEVQISSIWMEMEASDLEAVEVPQADSDSESDEDSSDRDYEENPRRS